MNKQWFYAIDDKQLGPVSGNDLMQMLSNGKISKETLVWSEGMTNWKPFSSMEEELHKSNKGTKSDQDLSVVSQTSPTKETKTESIPIHSKPTGTNNIETNVSGQKATMSTGNIVADTNGMEYTDYSQVPWFRKLWFYLLSFLIFFPVTIILLITGPVYYVPRFGKKKGQLQKTGKAVRIILVLTFSVMLIYNVIYVINIMNLNGGNQAQKRDKLLANASSQSEQAYKRNIDSLSINQWIDKGNKLYDAGNYTDAVKVYNDALELNPQEARIYFYRGTTHRKLGNAQQAISDYNKAIELNPQADGAYYNRGNAYGDLGNTQQAISDYNKAIELNPRAAGAYNERGIAYGSLGNTQQAISDFNKAIELNPQDARPYNNRGIAYGSLGNTQQQIKDYKIAARLGHKGSQDHLRSKGIEW